MNIFQIVALALISLFLVIVLKEQKSSFGIFVVMAFSVIVFFLIFAQLSNILKSFKIIGEYAKVNSVYLATIFKVVGIAYIGEFTAEVCRDCGSSAIASKVELACKVIILTLAMPILLAILENILMLIG